jgi:hypothetical protein
MMLNAGAKALGLTGQDGTREGRRPHRKGQFLRFPYGFMSHDSAYLEVITLEITSMTFRISK